MSKKNIDTLTRNVVRHGCEKSLCELADCDSTKVCKSFLKEIATMGKTYYPPETLTESKHGEIMVRYLILRMPKEYKAQMANRILGIIEDPSRNIRFVEILVLMALPKVATKRHATRISRLLRIDRRMSHPRYYLVILEMLEKLGAKTALKEVSKFRSFDIERIPASNPKVDCVDPDVKNHIFRVARRVELSLA